MGEGLLIAPGILFDEQSGDVVCTRRNERKRRNSGAHVEKRRVGGGGGEERKEGVSIKRDASE